MGVGVGIFGAHYDSFCTAILCQLSLFFRVYCPSTVDVFSFVLRLNFYEHANHALIMIIVGYRLSCNTCRRHPLIAKHYRPSPNIHSSSNIFNHHQTPTHHQSNTKPPTNRFDKISLTISSDESGVFNIEVSIFGVPMPQRMELKLEELLQYQFDNQQIIPLFDGAAKANVNLLIYLVNKKFYK